MKNIKRSKVYVQRVEKMDYSDVKKLIEKIVPKRRKYERIIIKPNLCIAEKIPGATTSLPLIRYVTRYFAKRSKEVIIVESDGLLNTADEAFNNLKIRKAVKGEGGRVINLSKYLPYEYWSFLFPHDLFINLPVLKTHEFTLVTGAVKNIFGMIPDRNRIKYHPILPEILVQLCKVYNNQLIIADGINAMEGHGPTRGKTIKMNVLIGGTNPAAIDRVFCKIMRVGLSEVPHIRHACRVLNKERESIICDGVRMEDLIRRFKRPKLDPITASKMWVWKRKVPNSIFFASSFYPVTRWLGLKIRKLARFGLGMEKID